MKNSNGLTYIEWLSAAGKTFSGGLVVAYHDAWKAGEDPCEWRVPS